MVFPSILAILMIISKNVRFSQWAIIQCCQNLDKEHFYPNLGHFLGKFLAIFQGFWFPVLFWLSFVQGLLWCHLHALQCTIVLNTVPQSTELSQLEGSKGRGPHRKVKWWFISMLMKWSVIDVLNIKQIHWIQGLHFS